jgi:class 3 adenylate cyclase
MQAVVRLHDRLMREAIAANGGYVFKTVGDAFCAAFGRAEDAAAAAVDAQRALSVGDFTDVGGLDVRMASIRDFNQTP